MRGGRSSCTSLAVPPGAAVGVQDPPSRLFIQWVWCERCLLITESPKTLGHYRYLIWVLGTIQWVQQVCWLLHEPAAKPVDACHSDTHTHISTQSRWTPDSSPETVQFLWSPCAFTGIHLQSHWAPCVFTVIHPHTKPQCQCGSLPHDIHMCLYTYTNKYVCQDLVHPDSSGHPGVSSRFNDMGSHEYPICYSIEFYGTYVCHVSLNNIYVILMQHIHASSRIHHAFHGALSVPISSSMRMPIYCFLKTFQLYYLDSVLTARWCFLPPVYKCQNVVALVQHSEATLIPRGSHSYVWHIAGFMLPNSSCSISIRILRAFVASESAQYSASWELNQAVWLSFTFQVHRVDFE